MISYEDKGHQKHLLFALELVPGAHVDAKEKQKLLDIIIEQLFVLNLDFKAGYEMANHKPELRIYKPGEDIFDASHLKVKNDYVWNIDYDRAKAEKLV